MDETTIQAYFCQQVHALIERSAANHEGFVYYFLVREPQDEEILALLAISPMTDLRFDMGDNYPTLVEALAALSPAARQEICREFRKELKSCLRPMTAA